MVMSIALVAVLVAPFRVSTATASPTPVYQSSSQPAVSLEERRTEAAYIAKIRMGTFPKEEPASRPVVTYPRKYPDNIQPERKEVDPAEPSGKPPEAI
jgi:hypothetical protein